MPADAKHIVALSGGKDSSAMALRLREVYPDRPFLWVCTPTGEELPEMFAHWRHLGELLGGPILPITSGRGFKETCRVHAALPNFRMRFCTPEMKILPFQQFAFANAPAVLYVGLRADEPEREGARLGEAGGEVYRAVEGVEQRFPLREWGWGVSDVWAYLDSRGAQIPERTDCGCCFFQRIGEWWNLWHDHRDYWMRYEGWEAEFGHTFRTPGRDSWPVALRDLRLAFESGRWPKGAGQVKLFTDTRPDICRACRL